MRLDRWNWSVCGLSAATALVVAFLIGRVAMAGNDEKGEASNATEVVHLWPGDVPFAKGAKAPPLWREKPPRKLERISKTTDPLLEVFPAPKEKRNGCAVIICPGGGYGMLSIKLEGRIIARWLNSIGVTAFVLQYRVPKNRDGALADALRAYRIVTSKAARWGVDAKKIGFMGFSAGGHLATRACCISDKDKSALYPAVDAADKAPVHPAFAILIYPAYLDKGKNQSLSPELKIVDSTPPVFIFATVDDPYSGGLLAMAAALRNKKKRVEAHLYPKGGHGYGMRKNSPAGRIWPVLAATWLEKTVIKKR